MTWHPPDGEYLHVISRTQFYNPASNHLDAITNGHYKNKPRIEVTAALIQLSLKSYGEVENTIYCASYIRNYLIEDFNNNECIEVY